MKGMQVNMQRWDSARMADWKYEAETLPRWAMWAAAAGLCLLVALA